MAHGQSTHELTTTNLSTHHDPIDNVPCRSRAYPLSTGILITVGCPITFDRSGGQGALKVPVGDNL